MIKSVIEKIEQFEHSLAEFVEAHDHGTEFSERDDLDRVHALGIDKHRSVGVQVLRALAPYYTAGALLHEMDHNHWMLDGLVVRGEYFEFPKSQWPVRLSIPEVQSPLDIKEGPSPAVWRRLKLKSLWVSKDIRTFLFRPETDSCFIFATNRPTLWLTPHLEKTVKLINSAFDPA